MPLNDASMSLSYTVDIVALCVFKYIANIRILFHLRAKKNKIRSNIILFLNSVHVFEMLYDTWGHMPYLYFALEDPIYYLIQKYRLRVIIYSWSLTSELCRIL